MHVHVYMYAQIYMYVLEEAEVDGSLPQFPTLFVKTIVFKEPGVHPWPELASP